MNMGSCFKKYVMLLIQAAYARVNQINQAKQYKFQIHDKGNNCC